MMKTDEQLLRELKQETNGLLMLSESEYPFEVVRWEGLEAVTPEHLRDVSGVSGRAEARIEVESADELFRAAMTEHDGMRAEERRTASRFRQLVRLLEESLSDAKAYRVGTINIIVYVVGRSASGDWLGVCTRVVET